MTGLWAVAKTGRPARSALHPRYEMPVFDVICAAKRDERPQVDVLAAMTPRIGRFIHPSDAVDEAGQYRRRPGNATADQCCGQGTDVKPPPPGRAPAAQSPTSVVEIETIDVYPNSHSVPVKPA
jgi:hypothetical protein